MCATVLQLPNKAGGSEIGGRSVGVSGTTAQSPLLGASGCKGGFCIRTANTSLQSNTRTGIFLRENPVQFREDRRLHDCNKNFHFTWRILLKTYFNQTLNLYSLFYWRVKPLRKMFRKGSFSGNFSVKKHYNWVSNPIFPQCATRHYFFLKQLFQRWSRKYFRP